jgi:hypothetical protein
MSSHESVKHIAISGPPRSLKERRYQPWEMIADPAERRLAVIRFRFSSDHKRIETHFVSPQLHLWQRSETEWLLALRQPERNIRMIKRAPWEIVQLRFPEMKQSWADAARL